MLMGMLVLLLITMVVVVTVVVAEEVRQVSTESVSSHREELLPRRELDTQEGKRSFLEG
jgi:hypothetical protein